MKSKSTTGIGLPSLLFIIFLVLKLTHNIDWSWWWVTSPLWIPLALTFGILILILFAIFIALFFGFTPEKIKNKVKNFKDNLNI